MHLQNQNYLGKESLSVVQIVINGYNNPNDCHDENYGEI